MPETQAASNRAGPMPEAQAVSDRAGADARGVGGFEPHYTILKALPHQACDRVCIWHVPPSIAAIRFNFRRLLDNPLVQKPSFCLLLPNFPLRVSPFAGFFPKELRFEAVFV